MLVDRSIRRERELLLLGVRLHVDLRQSRVLILYLLQHLVSLFCELTLHTGSRSLILFRGCIGCWVVRLLETR